jgi:calmodulin
MAAEALAMACRAMAGQLPDPRIAELREVFDLFDQNLNGSIDAAELGAVLHSMGRTTTEEEVEGMIFDADLDGNGTIEFDEFVELIARLYPTTDSDKDLMMAFKVFDLDGDGFISASELRQVMTSLGDQMSEEEVGRMLQEADTDGDGKINYEEFVHRMTTSLQVIHFM